MNRWQKPQLAELFQNSLSRWATTNSPLQPLLQILLATRVTRPVYTPWHLPDHTYFTASDSETLYHRWTGYPTTFSYAFVSMPGLLGDTQVCNVYMGLRSKDLNGTKKKNPRCPLSGLLSLQTITTYRILVSSRSLFRSLLYLWYLWLYFDL